MRPQTSKVATAAVVAVLGGAITVLGSVLSWADASAGAFTSSVRGLDGWEGKVTLLAGGFLIYVGVAALAGAGPARLRARAAVAGTVTTAVALFTAVTARDQVIEGAAEQISRRLGLPLAHARDAVQQTVDSGALSIGIHIGLYVVLAGGILGLAAALLAHRASRLRVWGGGAVGAAGLPGWAPGPPAGPAGTVADGRPTPRWPVLPPPPPPAGGDPREGVGNGGEGGT